MIPPPKRPTGATTGRSGFALILLFIILSVHSSFSQGWNRPTYSSPIAISRDDRFVWVVNPDDDSVSVIRTDTNARLAKIAVGDEPQSITLTPNGDYAYVANAAGSSVSIIHVLNTNYATFSASLDSEHVTGAEPWNIVVSPDGNRVFVANSGQDTITVINTGTRSIIGHVNLRDSLANDPDRSRHFQPRGLAVTADNTKLYVTRFLSFTKPGGRQGEDTGKEGLVAVLDINTASTSIADYPVARTVSLAPRISGFKFPGLTNPPAPDTLAFPNQLQSIVIRGDRAYLPNIAASPGGPLRFTLDTHAFLNVISGVAGTSPTDLTFTNLHLGNREPEPGKRRLFFANPWSMAFTTQSGAGNACIVSAASDLLVKLNVDASGNLAFTIDADTTRYIDLNDPTTPATSGANAGKNPQGIAINSAGTRAYVANFVSRNVSVVDLTTDSVIAVASAFDLPAPGSPGETNLVGAEMFFSSRGQFDLIPGTNSLRERLSSDGWQNCASCHFKGLTDGVVWQFAAGPRKSVALNSTFSPQNRSQQRMLNYSAIFDEIEDFEANIRNVSGPGPLAGGSVDPNHGLLIGDSGDLNVGPSAVNAFTLANANRAQVTVTLPGSTIKVPALTALREWVRNGVRTPNAPLANLPNAPSAFDIAAGRTLFMQAGCASCHAGQNWSVSVKDFTSPPAVAEIFTERTGTFTGNPVALQFINRFLRDVGSFNLGVPGQGNLLGNNIGADEKAAAVVVNGALQPAQDALGKDYNSDGRGIGYNVPSLLGVFSAPPYMHNGAAESLSQVVADVRHRTANGLFPDLLSSAADRAKVVAFLESLDETTDPIEDCFPQSGMVAWWQGGSGNDAAGSNHGTLMNGATNFTGKVGQAFSFDGVDDFISVANTTNMDFRFGDFTIELWFKLNSLATDQSFIHKSVNNVPNDQTYFLEFNTPNSLRFMTRDTSANQNDLIVPTSLVAGQWNHVAGVRAGLINRLYLNGTLIGTQFVGGTARDTGSGGAVRIGNLAPNGSGVNRFLNGQLDEICLFNQALPAATIQAIYEAGSAGRCGMPIYFTRTEHSGNDLNLNWLSQTGWTYRLQSKTNLDASTPWMDVNGDVTATNASAGKTEPLPADPSQKFYRVKALR